MIRLKFFASYLSIRCTIYR